MRACGRRIHLHVLLQKCSDGCAVLRAVRAEVPAVRRVLQPQAAHDAAALPLPLRRAEKMRCIAQMPSQQSQHFHRDVAMLLNDTA